MSEPRKCHCGADATRRELPDPWEGRMDGYCDDCSWARCDTSYSVCPATVRQPASEPASELVDVMALGGAQVLHEAYERLAPDFGYETRRESAVPWDEVPENNRRLMVAVAGEVLAALAAARDSGKE